MKRPRLRKWAKWACTLAAVPCIAAAVFSGFYIGGYESEDTWPGLRRQVTLGCGLIWADQYDDSDTLTSCGSLGWWVAPAPHWFWGYSGERDLGGYGGRWRAGVSYTSYHKQSSVGLTVLYPLALTLIPVGVLWYADRRRFGPGACGGCGYDRRGLDPHAKCPECGAAGEVLGP